MNKHTNTEFLANNISALEVLTRALQGKFTATDAHFEHTRKALTLWHSDEYTSPLLSVLTHFNPSSADVAAILNIMVEDDFAGILARPLSICRKVSEHGNDILTEEDRQQAVFYSAKRDGEEIPLWSLTNAIGMDGTSSLSFGTKELMPVIGDERNDILHYSLEALITAQLLHTQWDALLRGRAIYDNISECLVEAPLSAMEILKIFSNEEHEQRSARLMTVLVTSLVASLGYLQAGWEAGGMKEEFWSPTNLIWADPSFSYINRIVLQPQGNLEEGLASLFSTPAYGAIPPDSSTVH